MTKRKSCVVFSIIGILFLFCCMTGAELANKGNIIWNGAWWLKLLGGSIAGGILLGTALCLLLFEAEKRVAGRQLGGRPIKPVMLFWISWILMIFAWLPAFLAYYPGIIAYDFTVQLEQITLQAYNEHHPLCHTLLMEAFLNLGNALGDVTLGLGIYSLLQQWLLAAVLAGGIAFLAERGVSKLWLILLQIWGCLFPFHWYMGVSATKDTLFSAFLLFQLLTLCSLLCEKKAVSPWGKRDVGYLIACILMMLFRNNGRYVILCLVAVLSLMLVFGKQNRKLWLKLWLETIAAFVVAGIILALVSLATGAQQGDKREMLSMPIQQISRCMVYHGGIGIVAEDDATVKQEEKDFINQFILHEAYRQYRPDISDPVKRHTNTNAILVNPSGFVDTYLGMFLRYPGDYVNAALAVNAGYLYPWDTSHARVNMVEGLTGMSYVQTRWDADRVAPVGLSQDSKCPRLYEWFEAFAEGNTHLKLPLLKYLLVPGTYLWLYLLLAAWLLVHRRFRQILPLALIGGYYLTLLLGPTVQLRYIYPVMIALPYLALWLLQKKNQDN